MKLQTHIYDRILAINRCESTTLITLLLPTPRDGSPRKTGGNFKGPFGFGRDSNGGEQRNKVNNRGGRNVDNADGGGQRSPSPQGRFARRASRDERRRSANNNYSRYNSSGSQTRRGASGRRGDDGGGGSAGSRKYVGNFDDKRYRSRRNMPEVDDR